jgi:hypothetical protein
VGKAVKTTQTLSTAKTLVSTGLVTGGLRVLGKSAFPLIPASVEKTDLDPAWFGVDFSLVSTTAFPQAVNRRFGGCLAAKSPAEDDRRGFCGH